MHAYTLTYTSLRGAWWAHQLPPLLLRAGVAVTLVIEVALPFLLIAPFAAFRRVGVVPQVLLQVLIVATGNYNFFNLLTLVLCIPAWARDFDDQPWAIERAKSMAGPKRMNAKVSKAGEEGSEDPLRTKTNVGSSKKPRRQPVESLADTKARLRAEQVVGYTNKRQQTHTQTCIKRILTVTQTTRTHA